MNGYDEHLISQAGGDGDLHEGAHALWCGGHSHFGPCRRGRVTGTENDAPKQDLPNEYPQHMPRGSWLWPDDRSGMEWADKHDERL